MSKRQHRRATLPTGFLIALCLVILLLLLTILFLLLVPSSESADQTESGSSSNIFSFLEPKPKIPEGVTISGIDMSGLTEEPAVRKLSNVFPEIDPQQQILVHYGSRTLTLTAEQIGAKWDIAGAVSAALAGRSGSVRFIADRNLIETRLNEFFAPLGGLYRSSGAWVEGTAPVSAGDELNMVITLDKGASGLPIYMDDMIDSIMEACRSGTYTCTIPEETEIKVPAPLDLKQVFNTSCTAPIEPSLNHETMTPVPGARGFGFSIEEAEALLESAEGFAVRIPFRYLEPSLSMDDVWFLDVLGGYRTEYTDNENRNTNLRLACGKLNGLVLKPGESISYNQLLGKRTTAAGYMPAPAYVGTELTQEVGGGICQVSSTLYLSAILAELTVTDRRNHGYPVDYIPLGLDATVNWGTTDLKIRNDRKYAVRILAQAEDGYVTVKIMGVEDRSYTVKYEYRVDDHPSYASAYLCRYDSETGEEIYRKLHHTSIYLEDVWCWPGYAATNLPET